MSVVRFSCPQLLDVSLRTPQHPINQESVDVGSDLRRDPGSQPNERGGQSLEEQVEECLSCLAFPEAHRRYIRTTNGLERFNQEMKHRTQVVRIFPNREAYLRSVTSVAVEQLREWVTGRRYVDIEELKERRLKVRAGRR
jgi:transposase-like protein